LAPVQKDHCIHVHGAVVILGQTGMKAAEANTYDGISFVDKQ